MEPRWMVIIGVIVHFALQAALIVQAILRPHRDPSSRIAWIVVLVTTPVLGIIAYLLLGSVSIGRSRIARVEKVLEEMPNPTDIPGMTVKEIQPPGNSRFDHVFRMGYSVNGFEPIGGNRAELLADSCAAIDAMIRDIETGRELFVDPGTAAATYKKRFDLHQKQWQEMAAQLGLGWLSLRTDESIELALLDLLQRQQRAGGGPARGRTSATSFSGGSR